MVAANVIIIINAIVIIEYYYSLFDNKKESPAPE